MPQEWALAISSVFVGRAHFASAQNRYSQPFPAADGRKDAAVRFGRRGAGEVFGKVVFAHGKPYTLPTECRGLHDPLMACVGDFVYSVDPNLRIEAASLLFDAGDSRFISRVSGYWADFEQLALVRDRDHDDAIRTLKNAFASGLYSDALGRILLARRNSLPLRQL